MSLSDQWKAIRPDLTGREDLGAAKAAELIAKFKQCLGDARVEIMGQQSNVLKRQCVGLLFSQTDEAVRLMEALPALVKGRVVRQSVVQDAAEAEDGIKLPKPIARAIHYAKNPLISLVAIGVIAVLSFVNVQWVCAAIAVLLFAASYLTDDPLKRHKAVKPPVVTETSRAQMELDARELLAFMDGCVARTAQNIDNLSILDNLDKADRDAALWVLSLLQRLWECSVNNDMDNIRKEIGDELEQHGLKAVPYNGANRGMFSWLRTKGEEALIYPAICKASTNDVVLMGKGISPNASAA